MLKLLLRPILKLLAVKTSLVAVLRQISLHMVDTYTIPGKERT